MQSDGNATPPKPPPGVSRWAGTATWPTPAAHDCLRSLRKAFDRRRPTLLFILHAARGGTYRYAKAVAAKVGNAANVVYGVGFAERALILCLDPDRAEEGIRFDVRTRSSALLTTLRQLRVDRVSVFHALGFEARLGELLQEWNLPYDLVLTDYHLAATQGHLLDGSQRFVGSDKVPLLKRERPAFVARADRVVACSRHLAETMRTFWPDLDIIGAAPIDAPGISRWPRWRPVGGGRPLRVLLIDSVPAAKGRALWETVAAAAHADRLPLEFHLVSGWPDTETPASPNVHLHQAPSRETAAFTAGVTRMVKPHLAWLPFQAPETYSFVVSDALANRLPVLASAIGAVPERLAGRWLTWLLPFDTAPKDWLATLLRLRDRHLLVRSIGTAPDPSALPQAFFPGAYMAPLRNWRPTQRPAKA